MNSLVGKRLLLVDDSIEIHKLIEKICTAQGMEFFGCQDLAKAESLCIELSPHVILLDLELEKESGIQFLQSREKNSDLSAPKVIIFSAHELPAQIGNRFDLGEKNFARKPFSSKDLLFKIRNVIGGDEDLPKVTFSAGEIFATAVLSGSVRGINEVYAEIFLPAKPFADGKVNIDPESVLGKLAPSWIISKKYCFYAGEKNFINRIFFSGITEKNRQHIRRIGMKNAK